MLPNLIVRIATRDDSGDIAQFNVLFAKETINKNLSLALTTEGVHQVFSKFNNGFYLIAELEGKIVGLTMITREWSDWNNGAFYCIQSIFVTDKEHEKEIHDALFEKAKNLAAKEVGQYDVVTCMEMLEHVPDPLSIIKACTQLVKPGGKVFFSTLNRNPKSYLLAIIGAEYILQMLPKGTHDYKKFIKPSELGEFLREAGLEMNEIIGLSYNPITQVYSLGRDTDVNYLVACTKK